MNVSSPKSGIQTDDIDLLSFLEKAISFFGRYKWIFTIAIAAGLALGAYFYSTLSDIYSSRMIAHSFLLTNQEEIELAENWNRLLKAKEYAALAQQFNCSEAMLHTVKNIKAEEIQKAFTPVNPNGFTIDVNVTDNSILPALQKGIVYALDNGEYVSARMNIKRANYKELIDKTTSEIQKLDSTRSLLKNILGGNERSSSSLIIDASSLNRQLIEMNEKLLGYKENLQFSHAVEVLQDFNKFSAPTGPKLIPWMIIGTMLTVSVAFVFTFLDAIRRKLKNRTQSKMGG